jgi:methyl-accepting chemotaxis protein
VQRLAATMAAIDAAGRHIADISSRIDAIAAQTNILALNASVEASRAGEHGQGFIAVAAEVRRLSQRTAAAAREIKGLVGTSQTQLAEGSRQADDAGRRLARTTAQVHEVAALITAISEAVQTQSGDMGRVGGSVSLLDQSTQQNAALVEQSAAAAAQLREQAVRLADSVAVFRLGDAA